MILLIRPTTLLSFVTLWCFSPLLALLVVSLDTLGERTAGSANIQWSI